MNIKEERSLRFSPSLLPDMVSDVFDAMRRVWLAMVVADDMK